MRIAAVTFTVDGETGEPTIVSKTSEVQSITQEEVDAWTVDTLGVPPGTRFVAAVSCDQAGVFMTAYSGAGAGVSLRASAQLAAGQNVSVVMVLATDV